MRSNTRGLRKNRKAVSPAISTVIMTAAVISMILVAMTFANNILDSRLAENEFSSNKQFMLTTGLQVDDIAWTVGRTQTVRYSSRYGNIQFQNETLSYTFEVNATDNPGWQVLSSSATGMIMFIIPVTTYNLGNNYFERISPSSNGSFLQQGPSAPVAHVFCIEKLPMVDGSYARIVAVPSIRMLNSTITGLPQSSTNYFKFYLPTLVNASSNPYLSQSITMMGANILKVIKSGVYGVRINVTFPKAASLGYDSSFFNFDHLSETRTFAQPSVVEFYMGKVTVGIGQV